MSKINIPVFRNKFANGVIDVRAEKLAFTVGGFLSGSGSAALDNKAQAMVTESVNRMASTRIVIAHRLSTIMDADRICYLEHGVIREQGTYKELMEKDGLFATLAKRQMG